VVESLQLAAVQAAEPFLREQQPKSLALDFLSAPQQQTSL